MLCRPPGKSRTKDVATIRAVLRKELNIHTVDISSANALINASDILFTGKEFFVGVGVETNTDGALQLANTWPEYSVTPVKVSTHC